MAVPRTACGVRVITRGRVHGTPRLSDFSNIYMANIAIGYTKKTGSRATISLHESTVKNTTACSSSKVSVLSSADKQNIDYGK